MLDLLIEGSEPFIREAVGTLVVLLGLAALILSAPRTWGLGVMFSALGLVALFGSFLMGSGTAEGGASSGLIEADRPHFLPLLTGLRYYIGLPLIIGGLVLQAGFAKRLLSAARATLADAGSAPGTDRASSLSLVRATTDADRVNTKLRETLSLLLTSEERFKIVFERANDGFVLADADTGLIALANPEMARLTGHGEAGLTGMMLGDIFLGSPELFTAERLRDLPRTRGIPLLEVRRRDGSAIRMEVSFSMVDEGDRPLLLAIARDVSERERLMGALETKNLALEERERHLEEANRRLEERAEKMHRMNEKLRELHDSKDTFFSSVSHELRTPLSSIRSLSEILLDYEDAEEQEKREFVEIIHKESKRLGRLVEDVLDLARINAGVMRIELGAIPLPGVVKDVALSLAPLAEEQGVLIEHDLPRDLPVVAGDRDRIHQVLTNLVSNAIKYGDRDSPVTIRARRATGETVQVCVEDRGRGIPADDLERIFDRYRQAREPAEETCGGTGLGLAICREIISLHGGRIWGNSEVGVGSIFSFTLPSWNSLESGTNSRTRIGAGDTITSRSGA